MFKEWQDLILLCPEENRGTYQYAKETELVKICLMHLRHTEYDLSIKELLNDIKYDRKLAMMARVPHLSPKVWALSYRLCVYIQDFMPQQARGYHCSFYMRTRREVDWSLVFHQSFWGSSFVLTS